MFVLHDLAKQSCTGLLTDLSLISYILVFLFVFYKVYIISQQGWGCSSVVRASDRHGTDAGLIPCCGKGFFSQSQLSVQTLLHVRKPTCAIPCAHYRSCSSCQSLVDYGNTKMPSMHHRLGSTTLSQLAFLWESNLNFPYKTKKLLKTRSKHQC